MFEVVVVVVVVVVNKRYLTYLFILSLLYFISNFIRTIFLQSYDYLSHKSIPPGVNDDDDDVDNCEIITRALRVVLPCHHHRHRHRHRRRN